MTWTVSLVLTAPCGLLEHVKFDYISLTLCSVTFIDLYFNCILQFLSQFDLKFSNYCEILIDDIVIVYYYFSKTSVRKPLRVLVKTLFLTKLFCLDLE